ncbi:hypothetical protein [Treponema sp. OMZ 838]|uniref:hypothetical protein n=1 Tax=Treponema sp. OMZ 838 TaxID=1539298 RepID=UPI001C0788C3|nr:hypothetical protein [Treponema sp. OMZ 838]
MNGRVASVQRAAEPPPVIRRTALSSMRIKLTAKLKSLQLSRFLQLIRRPVIRIALWATFSFYHLIILKNNAIIILKYA